MDLPKQYVILSASGLPYSRYLYEMPTKNARCKPRLYIRKYDAYKALSYVHMHHPNDTPTIHEVDLTVGKEVKDETSSS